MLMSKAAGDAMRRREFVALIGGVAIWPIIAFGQQRPQLRRVGILTGLDEAESKARIDPLLQELQRLGWVDGHNLRIDKRVAGANVEAMRKYAMELVSFTPDVVVAIGTASTDYLRQATRSVPIVFTIVTDPLGAGFVNNLARPGGNATG